MYILIYKNSQSKIRLIFAIDQMNETPFQNYKNKYT